MRAQMLLREGVADVQSTEHPHVSRSARDDRKVSIAWALVEAAPGRFTGEKAYGIGFRGAGGSPFLRFDAEPSPISDRWGDESVPPDDNVTGVLNLVRVEADAFRAMTSFGRLYLRRTGFPGEEGMETFVACGIVVNPAGLPDGIMHTFEGDGDMACVARRDASDAIEAGMSASRPFERPVWGFSDVRRGFVSTMHPAVVASCARHAWLDNAPTRTKTDERELARLEREPCVASVRGVGRRDPEYQAWVAHLRDNDLWRDVAFNFDEFPTSAEIQAKAETMSEAFRKWRAEGADGPRFR